MTVSRFRHSLADYSTRSVAVVSSWMSLDGAIPQEEIIQAFKGKCERPKKASKKQKMVQNDLNIEVLD